MSIRDLFFSFDGRIGRMQYFLAKLMLIAILFMGLLVITFISHIGGVGNMVPLIMMLLFILSFVILVGNVSIIVKRLHDLNQSGWVGLWFFILYLFASVNPPVSLIIDLIGNFILIFVIGTYGKNRFGEDPTQNKEIT